MANEYNFGQAGTMSPEDYAQQQALTRQQQMAQLLMQQGQQMPQGQMVSGRYVPSSFFQLLNPIANIAASKYVGEKADTEAANLAQRLRNREISDIGKYNQILKGQEAVAAMPAKTTELAGPYTGDIPKPTAYQAPIAAQAAVPGNPDQANLFAASSYSPVLRAMGLKRMTEGPNWEKAEMPMPDGSVRHGWVNKNSPNIRDTFVEGGTKPAYTPLEGARFTYDTGQLPPSGAPVNRPVGAPNTPMQNIPTLNNPLRPGELTTPDALKGYANELFNGNIPAAVDNLVKKHGFTIQQTTPVQGVSTPMSNRVATAPSAMPVNYQAGNQAIPATGNAVPVSAMNRPSMSPKQAGEANQAIFTESEKERQKDLKALPGAMEQANMAIKTIDEMIGDARLNDKGEIVYQKYDPTSKKYVEGKTPHGGFENYVGATMFPGLRFIEGTDTASFEPLYKSIKGQAFLDAFQRLKGGGQITEVEGQKATEALLKLDKAQTEKDFIKYAREFQENLQRGMELAKNKAGVSKEYRSPVNQPALRWNPQTNSWVNQ